MMHKPAVIFDIDNTLYNFVDYFGNSFRAMLHAISQQTGISEPELCKSFKEVHKRRESLEYKFTIQEHKFFNAIDDQEKKERILHAAMVAFSRSHKARLKAYDGVEETLKWLHDTGYCLIAYTDAPFNNSIQRLSMLKIRRYFNVLIAWAPSLTPDEEVGHLEGLNLSKWFKSGSGIYKQGNLRIWTHPSTEKKPNVSLLRKILEELGIDIHNSWIVGDSLEKDLQPGSELGLKRVWAKYGKRYDEKNWQTLVDISPWEASQISDENRNENKSRICIPEHVIDDFSELRKIIPSIQLDLFEHE